MEGRVKTLPLEPLEEGVILLQVRRAIDDPKAFLESLKKHFPGAIVQAIDAGAVVDERQIQAAALLTLIPRRKPWIKDPSLRLLAFISIERQVGDAVKRIGIRPGETQEVLIIVIGEDLEALKGRVEEFLEDEGLKEYLSPLLGNRDLGALMERYGVTREELEASGRGSSLEALSNLLIERMAILSIEV